MSERKTESKTEKNPAYWSYRALMEDKKRCLTDIPTVDRDGINKLGNGEDPHVSHRSLEELKRHLKMPVDNKNWDKNGDKTPPHAFATDPNKPHFSRQEFYEKKTKNLTGIRERSEPNPEGGKSIANMSRGDAQQGPGAPRGKKLVGSQSARAFSDDVPTMNELMKPGKAMQGGITTEKSALRDRRSSKDPHSSFELLQMKKRFHATKLHQKPAKGTQSARELGLHIGYTPSGSPREFDYQCDHATRDPTLKSYQGIYPNGSSNAAYPDGREDPLKVGQYSSQACFAVDKRRHAANLDGEAAEGRARSKDQLKQSKMGETAGTRDEQGFLKPDFCGRGEKYRSQYALTQHKKRHLAQMHHDEALTPRSPYSQNVAQQELFTSHKNLEYGKRGHVVGLNSARGLRRTRSEDGSVGSSSCDVGKGISRMMSKHREDEVHTSQVAFFLKKKNHATSVHRAPKPPPSAGSVASVDPESNCGADVLMEKRSPSNPHHSCKAFALKKKYHQTGVHVEPQSRLHPTVTRAKSLEKNPDTLYSQRDLNYLKKIHSFEYNPEERTKPGPKPLPFAPVPRNGQWTPQHLCDER